MDPFTRGLLVALGTGGTVEMAERARAWLDTQGGGPASYADLLGLAETAALLRVSTKTVASWSSKGLHSFPAPVLTLAATKIWHADQLDVWADGHPELVGPEGE